MPQTLPWGAEYTLLGEFNLPANLFTLDDATLGVLDGNCYLDGRVGDDLTDRLLKVEISRGRHDQFQDFQAGTMRLTLSNNDRELDPVNTASRYFDPISGTSGVTIRRKVTLKYKNTEIFTGRITDIDISYDPTSAPNTRSEVTIDVADDFVLLANTFMDEYFPSTELSGARVNAILALPEVNYTGPTAIDAGTVTCLDDPVQDQTRTIDALQAVAATERGYLYFRGDGTLAFTDRIVGSSIPAKVFADDGTGQEYETLSIVYGQENLFNRVVCTPIDSITAGVADDATSQATFGIATLSLGGLLCSDGDAQTLADYLLSLFKDPSYRFDGMSVTFVGNSIGLVSQQEIIDLELGSVVRIIKSFSTGSPTSVYQNVTVEHIDHEITPQSHTISYKFSPASFSTLTKTATGSGAGTQTAVGVRLVGKTASGTGSATAGDTAVGLHIAPRTATGSGAGTQTADGLRTVAKTASGTGGATTGDTADGLRVVPRTATGTGAGSETADGLRTVIKTASGTGAGSETADGLLDARRTATGSGAGTQTADGLRSVFAIATGSGTGGESATFTIQSVLILDSGTQGLLDTNILGY